MMPPAPPRFSITTGWPRFSCSAGTKLRAVMSVPPPGAAGTMRWIGFVGYCAAAGGAAARSANERTAMSFATAHLLLEVRVSLPGMRRPSPLPGAPAGMHREVEPAARAAERCGVRIELRGVALALLVEEGFDVRAFVPTGLVVDDPANAVRMREHAVHHERARALRSPHADPEFAVRLAMRA